MVDSSMSRFVTIYEVYVKLEVFFIPLILSFSNSVNKDGNTPFIYKLGSRHTES